MTIKIKWEVYIIELQSTKGKQWKVTRKLPELTVTETLIFSDKEKAQKQFMKWLQ